MSLLKVKVRAECPRIDYQGFKLNIGRLGQKYLKLATKAWVRAVVERVPVYAGTARGTLQPLGRFVNASVPRGRKSGAREAQRETKKIYGKTYQLGFEGGKTQGQDFDLVQDDMKWTFRFHHELVYFIWDNYGKPLKTLKAAPWGALEAGQLAFAKSVHDEFTPQIAPLFGEIFKRVTVTST